MLQSPPLCRRVRTRVSVHVYVHVCGCQVLTPAFIRGMDFFFISQPLKAETNITNEACIHKEGTKKKRENIIKLAVHVCRWVEVCVRVRFRVAVSLRGLLISCLLSSD